jgi:hypothetical protein
LWDLFHNLTTNFFSDLWHVAQQGKLASHFGENFWFRWMQFLGTYQGYRQSGPLTWQLRQTFYYPRTPSLQTPNNTRVISPIQYNPNEETHAHQR